jgi:multidrug resistance efflux pump
MTWTNRIRLAAGVLAVLLLVAALTVIFNQRQSRAASLSATVAADTYAVGAAYGGTVVKQYVSEGDLVDEGDDLFTVQSVPLQQDLANGLEVQSSAAYDVDAEKGTLTYKATVSGQVEQLKAKLGNALGTGEPFAQLTVTDTQYVDATYLLSPGDYARVLEGAEASILLPDHTTVTGTVSSIAVATEADQALTKLRIDAPGLHEGGNADLAKSGTPVGATVQLRDDGPLAGVGDAGFAFLRQIGLR